MRRTYYYRMFNCFLLPSLPPSGYQPHQVLVTRWNLSRINSIYSRLMKWCLNSGRSIYCFRGTPLDIQEAWKLGSGNFFNFLFFKVVCICLQLSWELLYLLLWRCFFTRQEGEGFFFLKTFHEPPHPSLDIKWWTPYNVNQLQNGYNLSNSLNNHRISLA